MLSLCLSLLISAPPAPAPLPELPAPLGHFGDVVSPPPAGAVPSTDKLVVPALEGCAPQAVSLMKFLGGDVRALEQLQDWLDKAGLEKKLFLKKGALGEVMRHLAQARFEPQKSCAALPVKDGFKLELAGAPKKLCPADAAQALGDFWFFTAGKPAAVVTVETGAPDACRLRMSSVLFDPKGAPRVRLHADWGAQMAVTLVGDRCQLVEFTFDKGKQAFTPALKTCKR